MYLVLLVFLFAGFWWYFTIKKSTYEPPVVVPPPPEPAKCPKGLVWNPVSEVCKKPTGLCPPGYYGKVPCLECPEDMYCPGNGQPFPCEPGKRAVKGSLLCT